MLRIIAEFLFAAGLFINAALFIPQIILLLKKKHSDELSLTTFLGFCLIQFFIIVHGLYLQDWLLVFGYALSLLTCGTVTSLIIYYKIKK